MPKTIALTRACRSSLRLGLASLIIVGISLFTNLGLAAQAPPSWVQDELLVGVRPGVPRAQAEATYRLHGATLLDEIPQIRVHRIRVAPAALQAIEQALSRTPAVRFVDRNYLVPPDFVPNDPSYASEWHLPQIAAPQAWDISQGAPGVVIAILDSGIDPAHPDLAPKLVPGYNFYDNNTNTADVYGHGTKVAGAAAAIGNNGIGVAGVALQNQVMPIRVTDTSGIGSWFAIGQGLTWAADHGAKVMNLSFAGIAGSSTVTSAAQYVLSKGGLVVAGAGNCGCYDSTPDNPYVISVSATDANDNLASWSSYGSYVDVSAPGVNILTTTSGGGYAYVSGTSFSGPITAGVIGLMMSAKPGLTPADYENLLKKTAVDLGAAGYDASFGWGRVNAYGAVAAAAAYATQPDATPPTVSIAAPAAGSTISGVATVTVSATDNVGVTQVTLYIDGVLYASDLTSPYSFYWDTSQVANGTHTLTATASDAAGNVGTSTTVSVTVSNVTSTAPTTPLGVAISAAVVRNQLRVSVSVQDSVAIAKVELYLDGNLIGTDTATPYNFSANYKQLSAGTHTLQAKAYDVAGNVGTAQTSFTK